MKPVLDGVRVFLQVKGDPTVKLKEVKDDIKQLGATLALSEVAADLVVWHKPTPPPAQKKEKVDYVTPFYLQRCREENKKLNPKHFLVSTDSTVVKEKPSPKSKTRKEGSPIKTVVEVAPSDSLCSTPYLFEDLTPSGSGDKHKKDNNNSLSVAEEVEELRFAILHASTKQRNDPSPKSENKKDDVSPSPAGKKSRKKKNKDPFLEEGLTQKSVSSEVTPHLSLTNVMTSSGSLTQKLPQETNNNNNEEKKEIVKKEKKPKKGAKAKRKKRRRNQE
ncbi:hypothetical protein ADEAN_000481800 [Angomonas deanei]|uniref:BRCT domain-containing protein n=1 Tax=Angomonas deanei TaxID=59799 RepID=A0A7G2CC05_9TRYP|nr:hypothetical protein ADEAN_000481800 [Angomonas deanei]